MVYRATHLIILTSRDDLAADELGETFAAVVREALPDSKARVGRGPRVQRIASLIATRQADVAVVSRENALAMYRGEAPFQEVGPIALRVLVQTDDYCLICREDFLPQHGYLVAEALMAYAATDQGFQLGLHVPGRTTSDARQIPAHAGALAFAEARRINVPAIPR